MISLIFENPGCKNLVKLSSNNAYSWFDRNFDFYQGLKSKMVLSWPNFVDWTES